MFNASLFSAYPALIFDLDGTLVDSMPLHERAWRQALEFHHIPFSYPQMRSMCGMSTYDTVRELLRAAGRGEGQIDAVVAKKEDYFSAHSDEVVLSPVADLVQQYAATKKLAVGTGTNQSDAERLLEKLRLRPYLQSIVGADRVAKHKPAPDTFLLCAEELGVTSQDCLVLEDGDAGIVAARAAGMAVLDIRPYWEGQYFQEA